MVKEGDEAPAFGLEDQGGNPVRLSLLRGSPSSSTSIPRRTPPLHSPVREICNRSEYEADGAIGLGASPDPPSKLRRFADKYELPFTLLSAIDHDVAERDRRLAREVQLRLQVLGQPARDGRVDPSGRIAHVFSKVSPKTHDDVLLEALGELPTHEWRSDE